jgi:putative transposase
MTLRAYRYRIYRIVRQKLFRERHFACCRFVHNRFPALRPEKCKNGQVRVSGSQCKRMLPERKQQSPWLSKVNSQRLQAAVPNPESASRWFFKGRGKYPRFHKKHSRQALSTAQSFALAEGTSAHTESQIPNQGEAAQRAGRQCREPHEHEGIIRQIRCLGAL